MKKIFASFLVALLLPISANAFNFVERYTEGEQYTKVSDKLSKKPEVREYFSYYCPACMRFESLIANVKKNLPQGVSFERNHVDFVGGASPDIQFLVTKGLAAAQQLNVEENASVA